jgi:hypothetical protein
MYLVNKGGVVYAYSDRKRGEWAFSFLHRTNNGLATKVWNFSTTYVDLNDLAVNRAMTAAPIGTLRVTPSNNASEQTKVQWSVE